MTPALFILFIGCSLAQQTETQDPDVPRPSISISPIEGVTVGQSAIIECKSQVKAQTFYFQKDGEENRLQISQSNRTMARFIIKKTRSEDRGSYNCRYIPMFNTSVISLPSVPVELLIIDSSLPRPSTSPSTTQAVIPGKMVTLFCQNQDEVLGFHLHKDGKRKPRLSKYGRSLRANFTMNPVTWQDGGRYSCSYNSRSNFFVLSQPSRDPVDLLIIDSGLPRPAISISPSELDSTGNEINIHCQIGNGIVNLSETTDETIEFYLHRDENQQSMQMVKSNYSMATFTISNISMDHEGNYSCLYRRSAKYFVVSDHSDLIEVELLKSDDKRSGPSVAIIIAVCIFLFFLFLVLGAIFCYRRQHRRKR